MARKRNVASHWPRQDRPRTGDGSLLVRGQREPCQGAEEVGSIGPGSSSAHTDKGKKVQSESAAFERKGNKKLESHRTVERGVCREQFPPISCALR